MTRRERRASRAPHVPLLTSRRELLLPAGGAGPRGGCGPAGAEAAPPADAGKVGDLALHGGRAEPSRPVRSKADAGAARWAAAPGLLRAPDHGDGHHAERADALEAHLPALRAER